MKTMNDAQGMQIRGTSIAVVAGVSFANISGEGGSAGSINGYFAAGHHSAAGANLSAAASGDVTIKGDHAQGDVDFVVAGGGSPRKPTKFYPQRFETDDSNQRSAVSRPHGLPRRIDLCLEKHASPQLCDEAFSLFTSR